MSEVFCITGCLPIVDNMYFTALFRYRMYCNRYGLVWVWVWKTWFVASTSYSTCEWFARQKEIIYKTIFHTRIYYERLHELERYACCPFEFYSFTHAHISQYQDARHKSDYNCTNLCSFVEWKRSIYRIPIWKLKCDS